MRGNGNPATVNEEQLFVGLVHERLVAAKGEEVGIQYDAALENQMATISQDDGYVFMEKVVIASAGATPGTFFFGSTEPAWIGMTKMAHQWISCSANATCGPSDKFQL